MKNILLAFTLFLNVPIAEAIAAGCPPGEYKVSGYFRKAYIRSNGTPVSSSSVSPHCRKLSDAAEFAQNRFKDDRPSGWPHKNEISDRWSEEEKERVIEALEEFPKAFFLKEVVGLYRMKKSKDGTNPASSATGIIVLYDSAFNHERSVGEIVAHELAHQSYDQLKDSDVQDYRRATGWHYIVDEKLKFYWESRKNGYIEDDGNSSPAEDYANNLQHFLYSPDKLKKVTPSAYEWFKKKFGEDFVLKRSK